MTVGNMFLRLKKLENILSLVEASLVEATLTLTMLQEKKVTACLEFA